MTRVLIADDSGDQRAFYVAPLATAGFVVDEAADGGEVIDIVARRRPDAIVLDLVMAVLDGLEVCRRLKAGHRTAAIPIIVLTGHTLPGVREAVHGAGADAFLTRPCSPATLVAAIRGHLSGDASGDEPSREPLRENRTSKPAPAPDTVVNPAAGPRFRRLWSATWLYTIAAAVVLAIGITLGLGSIGSVPRGSRLTAVADMSIDQHQKLGRGHVPLEVTGVSHRLMERWFRQRVDFKVVLPNVKDPGVTLVGGRMSRLANADAAAIEYQLDGHRVSLFIVGEEAYNRLALGESPRFKLIRQRGYDVIIWRHGATGYTMVSEIGVRACHVCHAPDETFDGASLESFVVRL